VVGRALVDVFAYRDYRSFLRDFYEQKKTQKAGYAYADFAKRVGLRSPNYLRLLITGERNLSPDLARRTGEACGLRGEALSYFCVLVAFNQAKTTAKREEHYAALQSYRRFRANHKLDAAHSAYHSEWYIPAVFELCARPDFSGDPAWIAEQLLPPITPRQAAHALKVLSQLSLLELDAQGRWRQAQAVLETAEGPLGHQVVQFHRAMMHRAAESMDSIPREEREISSLTLCLSQQRMQELKAELEAFQEHLLQRYMKDKCPERVVQVNFQLFPLSQKSKKSRRS
jgi:uncharacterized protein (TIGR02147 family)